MTKQIFSQLLKIKIVQNNYTVLYKNTQTFDKIKYQYNESSQ